VQDTHVDDYFRGLAPAPRAAFERTRNLVTEVVPEAEQGLSYGIAALKYKGSPLLGFRAAKHHLSVVPFSPKAVDAVRDRLKAFDLSKGTIRFSAATPLPADVVRDLASYRKTEIDERLARPPRRT
jgi:uncharacterized protein YdhG (YjbR/CyaY superfamily)